MKFLLKTGNALFLCFISFWLIFAVQYSAWNIEDFDNLAVGALLAVTFLVFLFFLNNRIFIKVAKTIYSFLCQHKWLPFVLLLAIQSMLILTSNTLAAADTHVIYQNAIGVADAQKDYFQWNPNNFSLLLIYKIFYKLFGSKLMVTALSFFNALLIDIAMIILYRIIKRTNNTQQANAAFFIFYLLIGLSPQYLSTYSDCICLFLVVLTISFLIHTFYDKNNVSSVKNIIYGLASGILAGVSYSFRPPTLIFLIAGVLVIITYLLDKKEPLKQKLKKNALKFSMIAIGLISFQMSYQSFLNQQDFAKLDDNYSRTLIYYIDLGLTSTGAAHSELPPEVAGAIGADRNKNALKDIEKRIDSLTFLEHVKRLFYKFQLFVSEGMLGWDAEDVLSEDNFKKNDYPGPLLDNGFAKQVRQIVYSKGAHYAVYAFLMQFIWIFTIIGMLLYGLNFDAADRFHLWLQITLFGGIVFLLIFEAGRSRYLIQFLPSIIILASKGWTQPKTLSKQTS